MAAPPAGADPGAAGASHDTFCPELVVILASWGCGFGNLVSSRAEPFVAGTGAGPF